MVVRMRRLTQILLVAAVLSFSGVANSLASAFIEKPHIQVRLVTAVEALAVGGDAFVALDLQPEEGWHVYWRNPGDSGMPPKLTWQLPGGLTASEPLWPAPHNIPFGPLVNYGYEHVVLPVQLSLAKDFSGKQVSLNLHASWLVCKELCIPGSAELNLTLPVAEKASVSSHSRLISSALAKVPKKLALMGGSLSAEGDYIEFTLYTRNPIFAEVEQLVFFPLNEQLVMASDQTEFFWKNNMLRIRQRKAEDFYRLPRDVGGIIILDGQGAWEFRFERSVE